MVAQAGVDAARVGIAAAEDPCADARQEDGLQIDQAAVDQVELGVDRADADDGLCRANPDLLLAAFPRLRLGIVGAVRLGGPDAHRDGGECLAYRLLQPVDAQIPDGAL